MKLTVDALGAGSALSIKFDNSNFLFTITGESGTRRYLFDCGITAPKIWKRKLDAIPLDGIMLTHTHADHCGGIEEIAFHHKYRLDKKLALYTSADVFDRLWNKTLLGGLGGSSKHPEDFFTLHLDEFPSELAGSQWLRMQHVSHDFPNYGAVFSFVDRSFWISGDCSFHPHMFQSSHWQQLGVSAPEAILHEVMFSETGAQSHTPFSKLCGLPESWKRRTGLYHYDDQSQDVSKEGFLGFVEASEFNGHPLLTIDRSTVELLGHSLKV